MSGPAPHEAGKILKQLEQSARRRFGQHFLTDPSIVSRIVRGAGVKTGDRVLEIGPGLGVLTRALLEAGAEVTAIELDRDLAAWVREAYPTVRLIEGDAAKVALDEACPGSGWKVVANLPYNVGTTVLMRLLRDTGRFASVTVMLQLEVVQRLCAAPSTKAYGALTLEAGCRATPIFLFKVPPGAFHPPPKVTSAVLRLDSLPSPAVGDVTPAWFDKVVRAGFAQRRKTAANSLSALLGTDGARAAVAAAGIDPRARAESLDLAAFRQLALASFHQHAATSASS